MIKSYHYATNPFATRLMRHGGPFSGRIAFYACLACGLLTSLIAFWNVTQPRPAGYSLHPTQAGIFIASLSLIASLPLFVTYAATAVAVTYTQSFEYPFLCLTNLPQRSIIQGYLFATLYRCRALVALAFALCPALSLTMNTGGIIYTLYPASWGFGLAESLLRHGVVGVLVAAVAGSSCLLGMALGIALGLWWRHTIVANAVATVSVFSFTFWLLGKLGGFLAWRGLAGFTYDALLLLLFVPIACLVAWLVLRLSRRWARKP